MDFLERHFHRRPLLGGIQALEYNYFLSQFAYAMVGVFGVVYVYQLGVRWWQGLWLMLVYYGIQRLVAIAVAPASGRLVSLVGYRRVMAVSLVGLMVKVLLLSLAEVRGWWILLPAAVCGGMYLAAYHTSFNALFVDDSDERTWGAQFGVLSMLQRLALVVSPFVAGMLVEQYGFSTMFLVAITLLAVSVIPLLVMPHHRHDARAYSLAKVGRLLEDQPRFATAVYLMTMAAAVSDLFWPIFLLTLTDGYALLGAVISGVMLVSSMLVLMAGKTYDKRSLRRVYPIITGLTALFWWTRLLAPTLLTAAVADLFGRFFSPLWWMKVRRYEFKVGAAVDSVVFGVAHTLLESLGVLTALVLGVWLLVMSGDNWPWLALPVTVGIIVSGWLVRKE